MTLQGWFLQLLVKTHSKSKLGMAIKPSAFISPMVRKSLDRKLYTGPLSIEKTRDFEFNFNNNITSIVRIFKINVGHVDFIES